MGQTFVYPNLITGSRSAKGFLWWGEGVRGSLDGIYSSFLIYNSNSKEVYLSTPLFILKHGITYALSVKMGKTSNCIGSDIHFLYHDSSMSGWIALEMGVANDNAGGMGNG